MPKKNTKDEEMETALLISMDLTDSIAKIWHKMNFIIIAITHFLNE